MSWLTSVSASSLRSIMGNNDACYDTELQTYIDALIEDIEYLTGIDFDFPVGAQTKTFKNTSRKNQFVLGGTILVTGAWQTVTQVEKAYLGQTPTWKVLTDEVDYFLENPRIQGFEPITYIYFHKDCYVRELEQIRITGTQGFNPTIPKQLQFLMAEMANAYYTRLSSGLGAYDVTTERSLTRSVSVELNGLTSIQIFTPARIRQFLEIIRKYNIKPNYSF